LRVSLLEHSSRSKNAGDEKKFPKSGTFYFGPRFRLEWNRWNVARRKLVKNNSDLEQGTNMPGTAKSPEEAISRRLKALYNAVEQEEIPDRFLDLLERLDAAEAASAPRKKG
tara:strand:+ start:492 stop:827 length:336 start_codon:yes stop_codon:yes gene_type:complete